MHGAREGLFRGLLLPLSQADPALLKIFPVTKWDYCEGRGIVSWRISGEDILACQESNLFSGFVMVTYPSFLVSKR